MRVIGYVRVSTGEQADSGLGLEAQRSAIEAEAARKGWELVAIEADEGKSAASMAGRVGLARAFERIETGEAEALVVAKLDRLSRSMADFVNTFEQARSHGWQVLALDLGIDPTTPSGEMMATLLATFAQYERRLISERTKSALAAKRAQGARLGRPVVMPSDVRSRIRQMRQGGTTWQGIADALNTEAVPTAHGGAKWWPASVRKAALSAA